ncbi:MlaD family protein [Paraburkholderia sediminicola]|uniref:MlaD family protein n=1 Tax=Paraburkholderia TaxID=1822464 RepID=UPI0038B7551A
MKNDNNMKAGFAFVAFLLVSTFAGAVWYVVSLNQDATYQIYTQESVSGLIADAPIEFHGVEVGKVKSVRLVNSHTVGIVLSIGKTARLLQPASRRLPHEDSRHDDQSGQREFSDRR